VNENRLKAYVIDPDRIVASTAVNDVFSKEFDITWAFDDRYNKNKTITMNVVENLQDPSLDDGSVVYEYNNEWFRSDDFSANRDSKFHVLFAGCSESEGIASPLDEVWTKMLHSNLATKNDVGEFYSIARSGFGWQKVITNFMIYVEKYGFPTHFFVLLPNLGRVFQWNENIRSWQYVQRVPFRATIPKEEETLFMKNTSPEEHKQFFIDFSVSWKLFENFCKTNGVKLLTSTWDELEGDNINNMNSNDYLKSFFHIPEAGDLESFIIEQRPNGKMLPGDLTRRDGHSGRLKHLWWLSKFEEEIERRGLFND
jgi:hypothetical protein